MVYVEWPLRAMCTFGGFNCAQGHMVDVAYGSCALCTWWLLPEGALVECHPGSKRFVKSSYVLASFQCSLMALWALPRCSKLRVHLVCQTFRCRKMIGGNGSDWYG